MLTWQNSYPTAKKEILKEPPTSTAIPGRWHNRGNMAFDNDCPVISRGDRTIRRAERKLVCKTLRASLAENQAKLLIDLPSQGSHGMREGR